MEIWKSSEQKLHENGVNNNLRVYKMNIPKGVFTRVSVLEV